MYLLGAKSSLHTPSKTVHIANKTIRPSRAFYRWVNLKKRLRLLKTGASGIGQSPRTGR